MSLEFIGILKPTPPDTEVVSIDDTSGILVHIFVIEILEQKCCFIWADRNRGQKNLKWYISRKCRPSREKGRAVVGSNYIVNKQFDFPFTGLNQFVKIVILLACSYHPIFEANVFFHCCHPFFAQRLYILTIKLL